MSFISKLIEQAKYVVDKSSPPSYKLADDQDELGWVRDVHGKMIDHATEDDEIKTVVV